MLTDNPAAPLILVVEDDQNHVELIQRSFEDAAEEYRLEFADNLHKAGSYLGNHRPDIVLTDYRLPDGDGTELVVMVNETCPVVIMAAHGSEQAAVRAMKIGAQDYIVKSPAVFDDISRIIRYALMAWDLRMSRKQAADDVISAKKDWERTFDAVPDLISVIDTSHTILRVNKAMADHCGRQASDIVGRKCYEMIHGLQDVPCCCPAVEMLQDGMVHTSVVGEKRFNGIFDVTVSPIFDDGGHINKYVHVMRDVTNQKKTQELMEQRIRLRDISIKSNIDELMQATVDICEQLTDSCIGFFHIVDEDQLNLTLQAWSTNTLANMCTAEAHGSHYPISKAGVWVDCFHTREPVIHNDYASLPERKGMPPGHAQVIRELTVPVVINDRVVSIIGVGNKATPYTEHDVLIVSQFVTFASEVIARKKSNIALRESEEKFRQLANEQRTILNTTSVGICFVNKRKVLWSNPGFDLILGFDDGLKADVDAASIYADRETYESIGKRGYETIKSGSVFSEDVLLKKTDGSPVWCNLVGQAVNPENMAEGSIWIVVDISERKKAEEDRNKLELQFQQVQKLESLGVLSGGIAHDFNNILTVILGHCFMVKEGFDSGMTAKDHVEQIAGAANRAAELCRQMLAYAGKSPLLMTRVNLWVLVDDNVKMLQTTIKKNVSFKVDLAHAIPEIIGDSGQVQQVVMNLIINAAEAIGDNNGTIAVKLAAETVKSDNCEVDYFNTKILPGRYVCLTVSDDGCGMDEKTQQRIFEPFFTTKFAGRGLGMSAILGIIKSHGGSLQMSSVPNVGTTFKVYLPIPNSEAILDAASESGQSNNFKSSGTILIVDDELPLLAIASALLNAMGFLCITASNGQEALEILEERGSEINLIMLDLIMPVMGGVETFTKLRKILPTLPVLICSGYNVEDLPEVIISDPNVSAVQKPYRPDQLKIALLTYLNK